MKNLLIAAALLILFINQSGAQTHPAIINWIINLTDETASHYVEGNPIPIEDDYLVNVKTVQYSADHVYVEASGVPSYVTGPFGDGNPAVATDNEHLFQFPLNPVEEMGVKTATQLGTIGVFINGVPIYDWRDAMSYNGEGYWNRDAVLNELEGFDCIKGHPSPLLNNLSDDTDSEKISFPPVIDCDATPPPPAGAPCCGDGICNGAEDVSTCPEDCGGGGGGGGGVVEGTYHHHQNPSAFDLDLIEVSYVCDLYPADGLYLIDSTEHSPLLGFAFDGFPVYGAYGFANSDGSGGIVRIESSYQLRNITQRTHYADGTDVPDGPDVDLTYPLGAYMEDYEYVQDLGHLNEYNVRYSVTPEYPGGTYAYYLTVDENWNSQFPYTIGPEAYFGVVTGGNIAAINEAVTNYSPLLPIELIALDATLQTNDVLVEWFTQSEINNDYFTVERSADGMNFENVGMVKGAGNSNSLLRYEFRDNAYLSGTSYYRIKQTDYDLSSSYSKIVSVRGKDRPLQKIKIYPNPGSDFIAIQVGNLIRHNIEAHLYDIHGELMESIRIEAGSTIGYFDTRRLYSGQYYIRMIDGYKINTSKVTIAKK